jgi:hypothetical protein
MVIERKKEKGKYNCILEGLDQSLRTINVKEKVLTKVPACTLAQLELSLLRIVTGVDPIMLDTNEPSSLRPLSSQEEESRVLDC